MANIDSFVTPCTDPITLKVTYNDEKIAFLLNRIGEIQELIGGAEKSALLAGQLSTLRTKKPKDNVMFGVPNKTESRKLGGYGRLRPISLACNKLKDKSYVEITRAVRQFLVKDCASDVDIVNCHPVILSHLYPVFNKDQKFTEIDEWNTNREKYFQTLMSKAPNGMTRDDAKKLGFIFMYQGGLDDFFKDHNLNLNDHEICKIRDLVKGLKDKCRSLIEQVKKKYPKMWEKLNFTPGKREDIGKFSSFLQNIERLACSEIYYVASEMDLNVIDFCYDGLLVSNSNGEPLSESEGESLTARAMKAIEENLGMKMVVKIKAMDNEVADKIEKLYLEAKNTIPPEITIPDSEFFSIKDYESIKQVDPVTGEPTASQMEARLKYLNKYICYVRSLKKYYVRNSPYEWIPHTKDDLKNAFAPVGISHWTGWNNRSEYDKIDWIPWTISKPVCPPNVLNVFTGLKHKYDPEFRIDMKHVQPLLDHFKNIWACGDEKVYQYIIGWFSSIMQNPNRKTKVNIILKSIREGAGKNLPIDIIANYVIGTDHYSQSSDIDDLFKKFNSSASRRLLYACDEIAQHGNTFRLAERIKDITTRENITIEPKGVNSYITDDRCNYIWSTNNDYVLKIPDSDRRNFCIEVSTERAGDTEYFNNLAKLANDVSGRHIFHYFCRVDISGFNLRNIPVTEWKKSIALKSADAKFLTLLNLKNFQRIFSKDLMEIYNQFEKYDKSKYNDVRKFNMFWKNYTGWDPNPRMSQGGKQNRVQRSGFELKENLVLETIRKITLNPDFEFDPEPEPEYDPDEIETL